MLSRSGRKLAQFLRMHNMKWRVASRQTHSIITRMGFLDGTDPWISTGAHRKQTPKVIKAQSKAIYP